MAPGAKAYVARGNAVAKRGDVTITGDTLVAYYRDIPAGGTEIFRLAADGKVHISSPTQNVYGDRAVYDVDKLVAVVTGSNLKLITPTDVVTARDSLNIGKPRSWRSRAAMPWRCANRIVSTPTC